MQKDSLVNVALGKPAKQSSLSIWSEPFDAFRAVGAREIQDFAFHTDLEENPWWTVDLLWAYPLDQIVIFNRKDGYLQRSRSIKIDVSLDGVTWELIHQGTSYFDGGERPLTIPLLGMVTVRFVRLSLTERQFFHLSCVHVLARIEDVISAESQSTKFPPFFSAKSHRSIKIAVIGTSNSVMRNGYVFALNKDAGFDLVSNVSLGSCHATMVPYRLKELIDIDAEILIVDLAINEQKAASVGLYDLNLSREIFLYLLSWCARKNIIPVVLIMPDSENSQKIRTDRSHCPVIRRHYRDLCREQNIPFFDGYTFLSDISDAWNRPTESFFSDNYHLNICAAQIFGALLAERLIAMHHSACSSVSASTRYYPFDYIPFDLHVRDEHQIHRTTSIVAVRSVRISPDKPLRVPIPKGSSVVGLVFNMSQTNAALKLTGDVSVTKRLDTDLFDRDIAVWLVVLSLIKHVSSNLGYIEASCLPADAGQDVEMNDLLTHREFARFADAEPVVEVCGLIVRLTEKYAPLIYVGGFGIDLAATALSEHWVKASGSGLRNIQYQTCS